MSTCFSLRNIFLWAISSTPACISHVYHFRIPLQNWKADVLDSYCHFFQTFFPLGGCFSYFPIARIRYYGQDNLENISLGLTVPEILESMIFTLGSMVVGRQAWHWSSNWELTSGSTVRRKEEGRKRERKRKQGLQPWSPSSCLFLHGHTISAVRNLMGCDPLVDQTNLSQG